MIKSKHALIALLVPVCLFACRRESSNKASEPAKSYHHLNYDFGGNFFCIPLEDFVSGPIVPAKDHFMFEKRRFTRSDALLVEGGVTDKVRFLTGNGQISLRWSLPSNNGYYLRILRCSDIFDGAKVIRGYGAYVRSQ